MFLSDNNKLYRLLKNLDDNIYKKRINPILLTLTIILYFVNMFTYDFDLVFIGSSSSYPDTLVVSDEKVLDDTVLYLNNNKSQKNVSISGVISEKFLASGNTIDVENFNKFLYENTSEDLGNRTQRIHFIVDFTAAAYSVATDDKNKVNLTLLVAQACLETNFGKSDKLTKYNNFFGIKYKQDKSMMYPAYKSYTDNPPYVVISSKEVVKGKKIDKKSKFLNFTNRWFGIAYYCAFLNHRINNPNISSIHKRYHNAFKNVRLNDWKSNIDAIGKTGWSSSSKYSSTLEKIVKEYRLDILSELMGSDKMAK